MPGPYRESDNTPRGPFDELEWRRRVTRSALWAELLVVGELALLEASVWLPARLALPVQVACAVIGAALAVATWMFTAPRPRSRVGWRGWLLRVGVPAYLAALGLPLVGIHTESASNFLGTLLFVAALVYVAQFRKVPLRWSPVQWVLYAASLVVLVEIVDYLEPLQPLTPWRLLSSMGVLAAAMGGSALRRALLPVEVQWWFDNQTGTPGEWVALLVYRDGAAEGRWTGGRPGWFVSKPAAVLWLEDNGYLPAERARAERLVDAVPPDVVPLVRRRKRLRVEQNKPRVRVAAEPPEPRVDEDTVSPALDEAEPPRAVAIHKPDE